MFCRDTEKYGILDACFGICLILFILMEVEGVGLVDVGVGGD